eukprot:Gregarina_sp_Poly_1__9872@NODE_63_length_16525_cov_103_439847_g54_i0_p6_GENE_NODE_63_length_16525_cov_103_439847_g54_i0NODE_63_length_16525_cov_103_439847_g54_i0_p6_ORF_typecomplete_len272_score23_07tRNA_int_endo/PF01974_17/2_1e03tRNA_int_endo/PF01974_17/0_00019GBP_repeat/PF02526_14/0_29_NODE_63_length_16525_cov_103_439847_g54_i017422557
MKLVFRCSALVNNGLTHDVGFDLMQDDGTHSGGHNAEEQLQVFATNGAVQKATGMLRGLAITLATHVCAANKFFAELCRQVLFYLGYWSKAADVQLALLPEEAAAFFVILVCSSTASWGRIRLGTAVNAKKSAHVSESLNSLRRAISDIVVIEHKWICDLSSESSKDGEILETNRYSLPRDDIGQGVKSIYQALGHDCKYEEFAWRVQALLWACGMIAHKAGTEIIPWNGGRYYLRLATRFGCQFAAYAADPEYIHSTFLLSPLKEDTTSR